jgi:endonuclease YncB( thermonuclease family)
MTLPPLRAARIAFALAVLIPTTASAESLIGQASIIDGDTLEIHGTQHSSLGH